MSTATQFDPAIFGKVAVLYGGTSAERPISLESGQAVTNALKDAGVDVMAVDLQTDPVRVIQGLNVDRVFIALHGPGGEDGKIQALMELLGLPYTGSGYAASALAMDKLKTKQLLAGVGVATPEYATLTSDTNWGAMLQSLGGNVIVKPAHEGSSIGMSRADCEKSLQAAYETASKFDNCVIAEKFIEGPEFTVAILKDSALPVVKLKAQAKFFDYHAKYEDEETQYFCPSGLPDHEEAQLQALCYKAFLAVGAKGWGRIDVMQDVRDGQFYVLEVNTVPGMTSHSLVPMAAKAAGYAFKDLVLSILSQTLTEAQ